MTESQKDVVNAAPGSEAQKEPQVISAVELEVSEDTTAEGQGEEEEEPEDEGQPRSMHEEVWELVVAGVLRIHELSRLRCVYLDQRVQVMRLPTECGLTRVSRLMKPRVVTARATERQREMENLFISSAD
ncbi:unnamed protein product [Pleuronectes platessa]|uniref:Uncharacterized protein n=1 Tax=Pleuronectes platessa TaxID=8262 RepID=A0A9N7VLQ8_PLEPL|nr:unnamed protein product [Pleuronectes platessa]